MESQQQVCSLPLILQLENWEAIAGVRSWALPPFLTMGLKISVELIIELDNGLLSN